jgi:FMN reductase
MTTVALIGNPRAGSRTRLLTDDLLAALAPAGPARVLELAELVGVSFGPQPAYGASAVVDPFEAVRSARLLVVSTPAYKGSYTGLLKIFLDQFGPGALAGAAAIPVAVAASPAHRDATASALSTLLSELGAAVLPPLAVLESDLPAATPIADWVATHGPTLLSAGLAVPLPTSRPRGLSVDQGQMHVV